MYAWRRLQTSFPFPRRRRTASPLANIRTTIDQKAQVGFGILHREQLEPLLCAFEAFVHFLDG